MSACRLALTCAVIVSALPMAGEAQTAEWSIGAEPLYTVGHDEYHFLNPIDAALTPSGELVVADNPLGVVYRFDPEGDALDPLGLKGPGPSEFQRPITVQAFGDSVFIVDQMARKVAIFGTGGELLETRRLALPFTAGEGLRLSDGRWMFRRVDRFDQGVALWRDTVTYFAADPNFQFRLAAEGGYSGIACQIGFAERYWPEWAGKVPLILKVSGKTNVPSDDEAHSPLNATIEDAVRLGAHAVGYTLYVGSPRQSRHHEDLNLVREECLRYGLPLIVWAYPRGSAVEAKGGRDSIYAVDYAARVAMEMGADVVKLNVPKKSEKDSLMPKKYRELEWDYAEGARRVTRSAGNTLVLFSGGSKVSDEDLFEKGRLAMDAGATGLIFGRNMWQRPLDEALDVTRRVKELFADYGA